MRIISWNARGMGNDRAFREAQKILQLHRPQIMFLSETKLLSGQMQEKGKALKFENCLAVSRDGLSGGLALLWNSEVVVDIKSYSRHHIDAVVHVDNGSYWRCTGIYGHPESDKKQHTWTLMRRLAGLSSLPWLCFGDFNEILHLKEKTGKQERSVLAVNEFREAVKFCGLIDLGSKGRPFTWSNRRFGTHLVEERLDRFFCCKSWGSIFQEPAAETLETWTSDHNPILFSVEEKGKSTKLSKRVFSRTHYEDMWSPYEKCKEIVLSEWQCKRMWKDTDPVSVFKKAAKESLAELKLWSKQAFGGREKKLKKLLAELKTYKDNNNHYSSGDQVKLLERQIDDLLLDEEIYWRQRSRAVWLQEGDKNTKFFHSKASARKRKNWISGIFDENNRWSEEAEDIERMFCEYYHNLFTSTNPSQQHLELALRNMPCKVTAEMNSHLDQPFTEAEILEALSQMHPTKAPGPDGLPAVFFQKHWASVSEGVIATCLHILNDGGNIAPLNHTFICLIPKIAMPKAVMEYRPISLCNVIYRIIAKTIANRLKLILDSVISPTQSAFVPNRLITDNIIVGYECLHKIRHSKNKKHGLVALKLDNSKAYDRVEWEFLRCTLVRLGFSHKWIELVMRCISTTSFSVLINGVAKGLIQPQRGLRQGCPLSPYLFIICAEVFTNLLHQAESNQLIHGLKFSGNLSITHLLFADDSLVFTRATKEDCTNLKQLFDCYAAASGQIFNFEKSSMFFSENAKQGQITTIKDIFQLQVVSRHEKYLGLPSMVGRKKTSFFNEIKLRIINKISNWQANFFSSGGKEILIKAVAQAVPAYAMSVFKLPLGLCEDMQKAIAGFWWGKKREKRSIHWSKWERLCQAKKRGGLGFRDLSSFNQALVAKQSWRIIQAPESLVARVMKEKYFRHSGFMEAQIGSNPSYIWRSILWGREVIRKGLRWRIGDGKLVKVYQSGWLPRPETFKPISPPSLPLDTTVSVLIDEDQCWRDDVIRQHFHQEDAAQILKIPLPRQLSPDQVLWHYDKKGNYSVKSGYQLALQMKFPNRPSSSKEDKNSWNSIWYLQIPEKVKIFMWRATNDLLPTSENLWKRRILQTPWCQRCRSHRETIFHSLFDCKASRKIWKLTTFEEEVKALKCKDVLSLLLVLADRRSKTEMELIVAVCWSIWHSRNLFIFQNKNEDFHLSVAGAEAIVQSYKRIQMPQLQAFSDQDLVSHKHWKCPPAGWFKVNVDAAIKLENQRVGLGIVIRNSEGKFITAAIKPSKWIDRVDYAEAEATRFGLEVAASAGCLPLIVETDSKEVTDLVSARKSTKAEIFWIVSEVQDTMKRLKHVKLQHSPRACNGFAHTLAKLALDYTDCVIWEDNLPTHLLYLFTELND